MIRFLLGPGLFSGALAVSFREGIPGDLLGCNPCRYGLRLWLSVATFVPRLSGEVIGKMVGKPLDGGPLAGGKPPCWSPLKRGYIQ